MSDLQIAWNQIGAAPLFVCGSCTIMVTWTNEEGGPTIVTIVIIL